MSRLWVQALISPHALWLWNSPFVFLEPYFVSRVACPFNKVPSNPGRNVLRVARTSYWHKIWTDISTCAPHFQHT